MAFARINTASSGHLGAGAANVVTPATSLSAGNHLIATMRFNAASGQTIANVNDLAGNTYLKAGHINSTGGGTDRLEIWYAQNTLAHASNVVTATFSAVASSRSIMTVQYSGMVLTGSLGVVASGTGSGSTIASSSFTTSQANEMTFVAAQVAAVNTVWTPQGDLVNIFADDLKVTTVGEAVYSSVVTRTASYGSNDGATTKSILVATFKLDGPPPATEQRVSQLTAELVSAGLGTGRVSQISVELVRPNTYPPAGARITQHIVELISLPAAPARVTQMAVEVLSLPPAPARVTQMAVEVLTIPSPPSRITQMAVELLMPSPPSGENTSLWID